MPLDGEIQKYLAPDLSPERFAAASGRERLEMLATALEHPELWRQRFRFDMGDWLGLDAKCGTAGCAMGLACTLWPQTVKDAGSRGYPALGLSPEAGDHLFVWTPWSLRPLYDITEGECASAIRAHLAATAEG